MLNFPCMKCLISVAVAGSVDSTNRMYCRLQPPPRKIKENHTLADSVFFSYLFTKHQNIQSFDTCCGVKVEIPLKAAGNQCVPSLVELQL